MANNNQGKKTEAALELERLFGPEDEHELPLMDRMKLKLLSIQYRRETLIFKMFFDKHYRPERYKAIQEKMDDYKNINNFRTFISQNYYQFPLKAARQYRFFPWSKDNSKDPNAKPEEQKLDEQDNGNLLIEKRFLNLYTNVFKTETFLLLILGNCAMYMIVSLTFRVFDKRLMLGILIPGMMGNIFCTYTRTRKYKEWEMLIRPKYEQELKKYQRFYQDAGYEESWD